MKTISGKKAVVTGAASGIGRAIACALAREGAELCLLDVDRPRLDELAAELRQQGTRVIAWRCDLADRADLDARLKQLLLQWRGVDILVNNAGRAYYGPTSSMSDDQWDALVAVNLLAPAHIIRRLLPAMQERGDAQIVNVASVAGLVGFKRVSAYCLTKFGLVGFSESLRSELARHGVGVTVVCPGFVSTALFDSAMNSNGAQGVRNPWRGFCIGPETVAERVIHAIRKNRTVVVPGIMANMLWLLKRMAPRMLPNLFGGRLRRSPKACPGPAVTADGFRRAAA